MLHHKWQMSWDSKIDGLLENTFYCYNSRIWYWISVFFFALASQLQTQDIDQVCGLRIFHLIELK